MCHLNMSTKTFRNFFFKFVLPYKVMGLTPFNLNKLKVNLCIPQIILIVLAVILYWIGTFMFLFLERSVENYTLSIVANLILAIINAIALTRPLLYNV